MHFIIIFIIQFCQPFLFSHYDLLVYLLFFPIETSAQPFVTLLELLLPFQISSENNKLVNSEKKSSSYLWQEHCE